MRRTVIKAMKVAKKIDKQNKATELRRRKYPPIIGHPDTINYLKKMDDANRNNHI